MPWQGLERSVYWIVAVVTFLGVALWESFSPKFGSRYSTERRWGNHALMLAMSTVISSAVLRLTPVMAALSVAHNKFGLLDRPWLPYVSRVLLAVCLLDLVRYTAHRLMHAVSFLWRFHQVHHGDPDFDVATGLRVHPGETLFLQGCTLAAILLLAPPVSAVLISESLSAFLSFFGHANVRFPIWLENPLRAILVTADLHRIHHSEEITEQNLNFGDVFPWWDRMFGTFVSTPMAGEDGIVVGLKGLQKPEILSVPFMLLQPFMQKQSALPERLSAPAPSADVAG